MFWHNYDPGINGKNSILNGGTRYYEILRIIVDISYRSKDSNSLIVDMYYIIILDMTFGNG